MSVAKFSVFVAVPAIVLTVFFFVSIMALDGLDRRDIGMGGQHALLWTVIRCYGDCSWPKEEKCELDQFIDKENLVVPNDMAFAAEDGHTPFFMVERWSLHECFQRHVAHRFK